MPFRCDHSQATAEYDRLLAALLRPAFHRCDRPSPLPGRNALAGPGKTLLRFPSFRTLLRHSVEPEVLYSCPSCLDLSGRFICQITVEDHPVAQVVYRSLAAMDRASCLHTPSVRLLAVQHHTAHLPAVPTVLRRLVYHAH